MFFGYREADLKHQKKRKQRRLRHNEASQLTKRIEEMSEKLKPVKSEGIRFDFNSFTEPEQLVILKNHELYEKYHGHWTKEAVLENRYNR